MPFDVNWTWEFRELVFYFRDMVTYGDARAVVPVARDFTRFASVIGWPIGTEAVRGSPRE